MLQFNIRLLVASKLPKKDKLNNINKSITTCIIDQKDNMLMFINSNNNTQIFNLLNYKISFGSDFIWISGFYKNYENNFSYVEFSLIPTTKQTTKENISSDFSHIENSQKILKQLKEKTKNNKNIKIHSGFVTNDDLIGAEFIQTKLSKLPYVAISWKNQYPEELCALLWDNSVDLHGSCTDEFESYFERLNLPTNSTGTIFYDNEAWEKVEKMF